MSEDIEDDKPEVEEAPVVEAPPEKVIDPETIALARKYGWKEEKDSTLPNGSWMDAERFVAATKTQVRILRDELKLRDERQAASDTMARQAIERVRKQERESYEGRLAEIRAQQREAVAAADTETFDRLEEKAQKLEPPEPKREALQVDPAVKAHLEAAQWTKDPALIEFAYNLVESDPAAKRMRPLDQIKWAERKVKEYHPDHVAFAQPRATNGQFSRVDSGGMAGGKAPSDGLTSEEREAADRFIKKGVFKDRAEYAAKYKAMFGDAS